MVHEVRMVSARDAHVLEDGTANIPEARPIAPQIMYNEGTKDVTVIDGQASFNNLDRAEIRMSSKPTGSLSDTDRVFVGNTEMTAKQAYDLGYLDMNPRGDYVDPTNRTSSSEGNVQDEEGGSEQNVNVADVLADPHTEAFIENMYSHAGSETAGDMAIMKFLNNPHDADVLTQVGTDLFGVDDPEVTLEALSTVYEGMRMAAASYVTKNVPGVDPIAAFEWAEENMDPVEHREMMFRWMKGDPKPMVKAAKAFKNRLK